MADDQGRAAERYFFVHVMKTAGFSLVRMIKSDVFDKRYVYPTAEDGNALEASMEYEQLRTLSPTRLSEIRVFSGHFPYAAREYMGEGLRTFSLFRDPVERTISHLKHTVQRLPWFKDQPLEDVYANPDMFKAFYDNLQLRFFAVESIARGKNLFEPMELRAEHVDIALENVRALDVIGLTEEFETSTKMLADRFGWSFKRVIAINQTSPCDVPQSLRDRITEDLGLDRRFYESVRLLYEERKAELP